MFQLLRERVELQAGIKLGQGYEDAIFRNKKPEDFQANASRIEAWIMDPTTTCPHLDTLRDAIEFKKLNNNLLKSSFIEECIGDIYAVIYESNAEILKTRDTDEEKRIRMRVDNILTSTASNEGITDSAATEIRGPDGNLVQDSMAMYRRKPTSITP